jgi:hypothetical protein
MGFPMPAFIGFGDVGVWANNGERNAFLDWFADHRCSPEDSRSQYCKSDENRWPGCGIELRELFRQGEQLALTDDEYLRAAENYWPALAQLLSIIDVITRGEWQIRGDSDAAVQWRRERRLPPVDSSWLTENVLRLATAIHAEGAFDRLPILADALEEAGCTNADVLTHWRQPGEHVRGCWVVDLLLGKQ